MEDKNITGKKLLCLLGDLYFDLRGGINGLINTMNKDAPYHEYETRCNVLLRSIEAANESLSLLIAMENMKKITHSYTVPGPEEAE